MNDSFVHATDRVADHIENVLQYFPENPMNRQVELAWSYILDNYTKFQIATWGSLIVHEVTQFMIILHECSNRN